jgi:hypothetical protein
MSLELREEMIREHGTRLGAGPAERAQAVRAGELWATFFAELTPVVGDLGVRALYARTIHLVSNVSRVAIVIPALTSSQSVLEHVRAALRGLPDAQASATNYVMLLRYTDLLAALIGETLTLRLMHAAWVGDPPSMNAEDAPS